MMPKTKPVPGFPNYLVSEDGRVFSLATGTIKPLKPIRQNNGYMQICLCNNASYKRISVHRLVAELFCSKRLGCTYVNHKDGNKENNAADNLEWVTQKENIKHAKETLGVDYHSLNGLSKQIIRSDGKKYQSIADACRDTGCKRSNVQLVLRGLRKQCGGYGWRFA